LPASIGHESDAEGEPGQVGAGALLVSALSHVLSLTYLTVLASGLHRVRQVLGRCVALRPGLSLLGIGARLATEQTLLSPCRKPDR
jgi:hypothetical protein